MSASLQVEVRYVDRSCRALCSAASSVQRDGLLVSVMRSVARLPGESGRVIARERVSNAAVASVASVQSKIVGAPLEGVAKAWNSIAGAHLGANNPMNSLKIVRGQGRSHNLRSNFNDTLLGRE